MYFELNSHCFFVEGKSEGCIYDICKNRILHLSLQEQEIVKQAEAHVSLESIKDDLNILKKLETHKYGRIYNSSIFIDKIRYGIPASANKMKPQPSIVTNLYLQISDECNLNCVFCDNSNNTKRRTGCKKWNSHDNEIGLSDYQEVIDAAYNLGCKNIYIMGGEPFLKKDLLLGIISYVRNLNRIENVYICTNLFLLDNDILDNIETEKLIVHAFAHKDELAKLIDSTGISITKLEEKLTMLKENCIKYIFNLTISPENYLQVSDVVEYFKASGAETCFMDYVHDFSNKAYEKFLSEQLTEEMFKLFSDLQFFHNTENHPCLYGKLSLFLDGTVSVCPMMKDEPIGHLKNETISEMLNKKVHLEYWKKSLSKMKDCKDCGYRFACRDCRAIEKSLAKNINSKQICFKETIIAKNDINT